MKLPKRLLVVLAALACASANAQWHWIDRYGRPVFSDLPPPLDIPEKNVRQRPRPSTPPAGNAPPGEATAAQAEGSAPRPTGEDPALLEKRRQATDADAARRKAEAERQARQQADSCARAQQAKAGLDAGGRIARTNEKGEREFLDEAARVAEMQRIDAIIAADCK